MSEEGNMEELQRHILEGGDDAALFPDENGQWVRFSDVQEREARIKALSETLDATLYERRAEARRVDAAQARIEELEAELDRLAEMDEHHAMTAVRQSEMIDAAEKLADALKAKWNARRDALKEGVLASTATEHDQLIHAYRDLRSLLDSGEEEKCPDCGGSRSGLTPFFCGVCKGSGRAAPSPALHREGRGDFIGDDLSGVHTCHAECPCRESGPDSVAVPEKVEVDAEDLELILTDTDIYYPGYAEDSDEPSGLPERGAAAEDRLRAALAAFRATEEVSDE